jgi:hypothetical protein
MTLPTFIPENGSTQISETSCSFPLYFRTVGDGQSLHTSWVVKNKKGLVENAEFKKIRSHKTACSWISNSIKHFYWVIRRACQGARGGGGGEKSTHHFGCKTWRKRPLWRPKRRRKINIKIISHKQNERAFTELILLRIGKRDGRLSTGGSCKPHGISLLADELSAFQNRSLSLGVSWLFIYLFVYSVIIQK